MEYKLDDFISGLQENSQHKSGIVAIIGKPNVGKSTFINTIMNEKISIVSPKPNTTRNQIHAIYDNKDYQIVFVDTPGINNTGDSMGHFLNKIAINGIKDAEIICIMFAANQRISDEDIKTINILQNTHTKAFIIAVLSKIDLIKKNDLVLKLNEVQNLYKWDEIIPISSLKNDNIDTYMNLIKNNLNFGPKYYDGDMTSNISRNFLIKEIIREKCFLSLNKEIPYSTAVSIEKIIKDKNKLIIYANIITSKKSQKPILIGHGGTMIKNINISARKELEDIFKCKIYLELFVKVDEKWENSNQTIIEYLDSND